MKKILLFSIAILTTTACEAFQSPQTEVMTVPSASETKELLPLTESKTVKNIIFLIGDGTGLAQISAGQLHHVGREGLLHMQTMPVTGIVKTYASNNLITDSAAGATAYSCGLKTYNGAIAVDPEKQACKTILEMAEEKGFSTGLVSTSGITHATPASFAAHVESRGMQQEIAAQYLTSGVEVFLGGGTEFFNAGDRDDGRDLPAEFADAGYTYVKNAEELESASGDRLLGLFAPGGLERKEGEPDLQQMTEKALGMLSENENGFFLMVEGSQIDWGGHENNTDYVLDEIEDFDRAIKAALDFAREDGETLVVVTADHETGGMTMQKQEEGGDALQVYWTTDYHTGIPVPLMAYGPSALEFMGWRENTYVGQKMAELLKLGPLPELSSE